VIIAAPTVLAPAAAPAKHSVAATTAGAAAAGGGTGAGHALLGAALWVNPNNQAAAQVTAWRAAGQTADADQLTKISTQPTASWLASDSAGTLQNLSSVLSAAGASGRVPVIVLYDIPGRDCSGFSAGGAASSAAYLSWVSAVAARIGSARVAVIVEPDAIDQTLQGCGSTDRYALLASAVKALKALPRTAVYLDAGSPGWITNTALVASALSASGVATADGFAVNVSNFATTAANVAFGNSLSAQLHGAHFVIDTSRNGLGPLPAGSGYAGPSWCNPPGRAIGPRPTTNTGYANVDAFLWVKPPGASDGDCGVGDPGAGQWWATYALGLAQRG
jgi:endoglucanase